MKYILILLALAVACHTRSVKIEQPVKNGPSDWKEKPVEEPPVVKSPPEKPKSTEEAKAPTDRAMAEDKMEEIVRDLFKDKDPSSQPKGEDKPRDHQKPEQGPKKPKQPSDTQPPVKPGDKKIPPSEETIAAPAKLTSEKSPPFDKPKSVENEPQTDREIAENKMEEIVREMHKVKVSASSIIDKPQETKRQEDHKPVKPIKIPGGENPSKDSKSAEVPVATDTRYRQDTMLPQDAKPPQVEKPKTVTLVKRLMDWMKSSFDSRKGIPAEEGNQGTPAEDSFKFDQEPQEPQNRRLFKI